MIDRLLARLHGRKPKLLRVRDRPEIPLHTNASETDIRTCVTKREISGGTGNDAGRNCRDAFLNLAKTCAPYSAVISTRQLISHGGRDGVGAQNADRIEVFRLPPYALERKPDEYVTNDVKQVMGRRGTPPGHADGQGVHEGWTDIAHA